ncbi:hypothetical protein F0310_04505 (plasmid) [Borrelia sp. A-FGy1]|uniref:hypothetical protein n=1 Tax=Borrelia sp. A-FGy1 TaxID=2608247 RepID=UPI0015F76973|nr:hypothetical protein [Borrelia sp. A-FGy1]QMU99679.1 hypothetical protein F0310_04505 [Borrelia sp. A-FGy1]
MMSIFSKLWGFFAGLCLMCFYAIYNLLRLAKTCKKGQIEILKRNTYEKKIDESYRKDDDEFFKEFNRRK